MRANLGHILVKRCFAFPFFFARHPNCTGTDRQARLSPELRVIRDRIEHFLLQFVFKAKHSFMKKESQCQGCRYDRKNKQLVAGLLAVAGAGALLWLRSKRVKRPKYVQVVQDFDIHKYAGKWYEIARFDFKHERHLSRVTANYSLNPDGSVNVENKGYDFIKKQWKTSTGIAKFLGHKTEGALKVSFFRPFYSGYYVVLMDPDYENALVFGEQRDYIWFLSRNKKMAKPTKDKFIKKAAQAGYDMSRLVWTEQD